VSKGKIRKPKADKSSRLTVIQPPNYDKLPPIFSLEKIVGDKYCFSNLDDKDKKQFAESIFKRKNLSWSDIKKAHRHALGFEKIPKNSIKGTKPSFITDDINEFLSFRFNGMKPMVGYRTQNIFYVLWFDLDYTLYKH
jgi:hypothetical protein